MFSKIDNYRWLVPKTGDMRVDGLVYTTEDMLSYIAKENVLQQVTNVATLPGITGMSMAMPDVHWGYGFPIGGVAATDPEKGGVISPGGIGFDINCGVRILRTSLEKEAVSARLGGLVNALFEVVPSGVGASGKIKLSAREVGEVLEKGSSWAVERGYGEAADLEYTEENGRLGIANPEAVSRRARERGLQQLGTLGAGNHFLEIQVVDKIYNEAAAGVFGLFPGQVTIMIHTGSRGLGYQVCDDSLKTMGAAVKKYGIKIPDRQLACAPLDSVEGREYLGAMSAAANYAWANRQCIMHRVREVFRKVLVLTDRDLGMTLIYDVAHNIGKLEKHLSGGKEKTLCIHRKGATRAFPAGHTGIPAAYRATGQPVIIPGTMGTCSYIMLGTDRAMKETWGSTCHGAGRMMSRSKALKLVRGEALQKDLENKNILVRAKSYKTLAEEAPGAYKDVNAVVDICSAAGISEKVAKLKPLAVIKG